jgi:hypothetical protein
MTRSMPPSSTRRSNAARPAETMSSTGANRQTVDLASDASDGRLS